VAYFVDQKPVLPSSVQRVNPDGTPTKELIDWETGTLNFFEKTVNALEADDAATNALVATVEDTANGATASGALYLIAESAPTGYSASYGWYITAGTKYAGMSAMVSSGGDAVIAFTAEQFLMTDPSYNGGVPGNVFEYDSGAFQFNVPVRVLNQDIGANAVTNHAIACRSSWCESVACGDSGPV
jgi:hypothetical protein